LAPKRVGYLQEECEFAGRIYNEDILGRKDSVSGEVAGSPALAREQLKSIVAEMAT